MKTCDIVLIGVGGQGVVTLGDLIARAALTADVPLSYVPTKGMAQRLGIIASQPARGPKSRLTGAEALEKSVGGGDGGESMLKSAQVFQALDAMMQKSMAEGRQGASLSGHDLAFATSKFEHERTLHPALLAEVKSELGL